MKRFRRQYFSLFAALTLLAASLSGCGGSSEPVKASAAAEETMAQSGAQSRKLEAETEAPETEEETEAAVEEKALEETESEAAESEAPEKTEAEAETEEETEAETEKETLKAGTSAKNPKPATGKGKKGKPVSGIPVYAIERRTLTEYDHIDDEYKQLSGSEFDCVYLTDEAAAKFPQLDKALNDLAEERISRFNEEFSMITGEARSLLEDGYPLYAPLSSNSYAHIHRADASVFSFLGEGQSYLGGAHGDYGYGGYTFDTQTGEKLTLSDVVKDIPAMGELVLEKLRTDYDERIFFESYVDNIHECFDGRKKDEDEEVAFTLEPDGISFWFGPYFLAAYASGMQTVHIRFDEAPDLFDDRFTTAAGQNYAIEMSDYLPLKADLGQNGTTDEILVWGDRTEYGEYTSLHVSINGIDCKAEDAYFYHFEPVYIRAYDHDILLVDTSTDNDYRIMYTFDLREDGAVYFGSENAAFDGDVPERFRDEWEGTWRFPPADTSHFRIWRRYDLLSTSSASRWYSIGAQDVLIPETEYYDVTNDYFELTLLRDMEFDRIDEKTNRVVEEKVVVPEGTKLKFFRSDCETYTDLKDKDGNVYRVKMDEKEDWPPTISGYELEECFDGIMFAG